MSQPINAIYDESYFKKYENRSNGLWWSSASRVAVDNSQNAEILEIDLSKKRTINYVSFDILKKPIDIKIEYDAIGLEDLSKYSTENRWVEVVPHPTMPFDNSVDYEAQSRNQWKNCEFYFTDQNGNTVFARRLRITFSRRLDAWPTPTQTPFAWSIDINNLRVMRYTIDVEQMRGTLIEVNNQDEEIDMSANDIVEIVQRFQLPNAYRRVSAQEVNLTAIDGFTTTDVYPRMLGFGFYALPENVSGIAEITWSLYDISYGGVLLASGKKSFEITAVPLLPGFDDSVTVNQQEQYARWFDILFDYPVDTDPNAKYELRLKSSNKNVLNKIYSFSSQEENQNNNLFYDTSRQGLVWKKKRDLAYRIFGDVGSSGIDILGNEYREAVRSNKASNALDNKSYTFWMSKPNPSPNGVESLYLDVREIKNGNLVETIIEGLEINTGTPGVMMNVYYSTQKIEGAAPRTNEEWENMMWTPVRQSFILNKKEKILLPTFRANFVCLEFYNLQPYLFNLPNFPMLPEVEYKEFPDWVTAQTQTAQTTMFTKTGVQTVYVPYFDLFNREDPNALPLPSVNLPTTTEERQQQEGYGDIDLRTASQISVLGNDWQSDPATNVDSSSIVGRAIQNRYTQDLTNIVPKEKMRTSAIIDARNVSNLNNRIDNVRSEHRAMMFNRVCAHNYNVYKAKYNKKAYVVSVSEVSFFRKDYTTKADDPIIRDILADYNVGNSPMVESNNWMQQEESRIPLGEKLYVSYVVGDVEYLDEPIYLDPEYAISKSSDPISLQRGGELASNVRVHSDAGFRGSKYIRDLDYIITYDPYSKINKIARNPLHYRLVVGQVQHSKDAYTVEGYSNTSSAVERMRHGLEIAVSTSATTSGDLSIPLEGTINSGSYLYVTLVKA